MRKLKIREKVVLEKIRKSSCKEKKSSLLKRKAKYRNVENYVFFEYPVFTN